MWRHIIYYFTWNYETVGSTTSQMVMNYDSHKHTHTGFKRKMMPVRSISVRSFFIEDLTIYSSLVGHLLAETRMSRCESPSPRSFKLSREAASTVTDPHTLVTRTPWGWLRRILTLETQSAELRPMSNNWPDRGYATPAADLFTYRWPQHLKSCPGGAGVGGQGQG